jgi:hypothetical protein
MLRDVFVALINKGQFPMVIAGLVAVVIILKMPPQDVSKLVFRLLDVSEMRWYAGYLLAVITVFSWFFHSRYQRRVMTGEVTRVSEQRNRLQKKELGPKVESSEKRR